MITNMITFVIVNEIYNYHDYNAFELNAKATSCIFVYSHAIVIGS
jgi:hypothetical protein